MNSQRYQPFPNTHWSLVHRAGTGDSMARRQALSVLLARYEPALRSYLRVVRRLGDEADDVLQAFVADKVLEREMLRHADEGRGRFRTFLLTSLNNYLTSLHRSQGSSSRGALPLAAADAEQAGAGRRGRAGSEGGPAVQVEAAWARALVRDVLQAMRAKCEADGREDVWTVFAGRILAEVFEDREPVAYEVLAKRLGLASPTQAANLLVTGKRLYGRLLRVAISEYERGEEQIEAEIADLRAVLSRGGLAAEESSE